MKIVIRTTPAWLRLLLLLVIVCTKQPGTGGTATEETARWLRTWLLGLLLNCLTKRAERASRRGLRRISHTKGVGLGLT